MNAIIRLFLSLLMGFFSTGLYGECPFKNYTDVITACVGKNDLGIVYPAKTNKGEVDFFPLRQNPNVSKGFTHGIGCLDETPSPSWYAIKIENPGHLLLKISHSEGADIDFVCWGPFYGESKQSMLETVCANADFYFEDHEVQNSDNTCRLTRLAQCETKYAVPSNASDIEKVNSNEKISKCRSEINQRTLTDPNYDCFYGNYDPYPISKMADCSFSSSADENCFLSNTKRGEWYIFLVTNFYRLPGNISFSQVGGSATTDCSVIVDAGSNSPVCEGETIELRMNNMPTHATCLWTGPNGFVSNEVSPKITGAGKSNAGTYYVQITTHDGLQSDEIPVNVSVIANAPVDTTIRMVEGYSVKFKGTEFSKAGDYVVQEKSGVCMKTYNVKVEVMPLLPAFIEHNGPLCEGDTLVLSVGDAPTSGVQDYEWSGPNGYHSKVQNPVVRNMDQRKAGSYSLKIKKDGLVYPVAPVNVEVIPKIKEKVMQHIPYGETFEFAGETLEHKGVYSDTIESSLGCDSIVELYLVIDLPELVPMEFFTPNGDGENDVWNIKNIEIFPEAEVRIYDRNGNCIYTETEYGPDKAWNGKDEKGRDLPSTDYWYVIDVQSADRVYYGHFTLLR